MNKGGVPANFHAHTMMQRAVAAATGRKPPHWLESPETAARVQKVWALRVQRLSMVEIAKELGMSVGAVERDINRARDLAAYTLVGELTDIIATQVEARRAIQRTAWREIENLVTSPIPEREREQAIVDGLPLRRWTASYPQRARAVAQLLTVISAEERAIEEILSVRRKGVPDRELGRALDPSLQLDPELEDGGEQPVVVYIDARTIVDATAE